MTCLDRFLNPLTGLELGFSGDDLLD